MAMDVGGAKGGLKSDINVTPLVDVMLVLLIIMMLIAPMLQQGVSVQLPQASNTEDKPETQDQTVVAVTSDKRLFLNGVPVQEGDLQSQIQTMMETRNEKIVLIKGDEDAPYSAIMNAMDRLRAANIENIGLITERKIGRAGTGGQ
jgi:biopolymer transport protein TolR